MKKTAIRFICLVLILFPLPVWADDPATKESDPFSRSEEDMFSNSTSVEAVEGLKDNTITDKFDQGTFGFSGELRGTAGYTFATDRAKADTSVYGHTDAHAITLDGDILFDARWRYGIKFFSDVYLTYTPVKETGRDDRFLSDEEDDYDTLVREAFGDVNIAQKVYFRIGKQTLKWGKGYFWNPTDLISTDKKDFNDIEARREGAYGIKIQIPFGTGLNLYSFIDTTDTDEYSDSAFAGKVEFLVLDNTELSFSAWTKKAYQPVYGFDFSTYGFDTQWRGELSLSKGGNRHYLVNENGTWVDQYDPDEMIVQMVWGFTKKVDIGDITDRLSLTGEFLINPKGYEENMLARTPLTLPGGIQMTGVTLRELFLSRYYTPNYYGKTYAAFFASYSHLLDMADLTLSANGIANISDGSSVIATNLNYNLTFDTLLTLTVSTNLGPDDREYTFTGNLGRVEGSFTMTF
ncbi:MAG: hypothetical protein ABIK68_13160 [bacterium]